MRITELLMMDLSLDWLWERLPRCPVWLDELIDKAHFALLINGAVLVVAAVLSLMALDVFDPSYRPSLKTLVIGMVTVSLLVWVLIFGIWGWRAHQSRRRAAVEAEPTDLWDRWLDGPV
jgi:hypothetical protein